MEELSIDSFHIEMDCKQVVAKIQSQDRDLSTLIAEVKHLLESRQRWKVSWVRRSANGATHGLAKVGVGIICARFGYMCHLNVS